MTTTENAQLTYWNNEHFDKKGVPQVDSEQLSSGVVLAYEWLQDHGIDLKDLKGIEVGCGKGRNVIGLARLGATMTGIDFSPIAIDEARRRAAIAGLTNVFFQVQDATKEWAVDKDSFDLGIDCFFSVDIQGQEKREKAVAQMVRVIRPGGYVFVYTLSSDDAYCQKWLNAYPLQEEPNAYRTPTGKFEVCFDRDQLIKLYGNLTLVEEKRVEKFPQFDGVVYPAKHHWMIFQKPMEQYDERIWNDQQQMFELVYPDSRPISLIELQPPDDLKDLVEQMSSVARYQDTEHVPDNCIDDDGKRHLYRGYARFQSAPGNLSYLYPDSDRLWWVHDFGELGSNSDKVTTQKFSNGNLDDLDEQEIARKNLKDEDYQLYLEFEQAGKFLRGKTDALPTMRALILKVVDFADGPVVYFYNYCRWLKEHDYKEYPIPDVVFEYTLHQNNTFRTNLLSPGIDKETRDNCTYLLYQQIKVVISLWQTVQENNIPPVMQNELAHMNEYLSG